jgi:ABC-type spermidine/putrescine transport system permease subunit II
MLVIFLITLPFYISIIVRIYAWILNPQANRATQSSAAGFVIRFYGMLRRGIKPEINAIATVMLVFSFIIASVGLYLRTNKK